MQPAHPSHDTFGRLAESPCWFKHDHAQIGHFGPSQVSNGLCVRHVSIILVRLEPMEKEMPRNATFVAASVFTGTVWSHVRRSSLGNVYPDADARRG